MEVVAVAMAVFGFVYGYVGAAGHGLVTYAGCVSLGQCLQDVVDAGPPWFYPEALIPGAIAAAVFAAFVYLLFLSVYGVRRVLHRRSPAQAGQEPPGAQRLRVDQPSARTSPQAPTAEHCTEPPAVQVGPRRWSRPTPLVITIGAALAWAVLSVGPATLATRSRCDSSPGTT